MAILSGYSLDAFYGIDHTYVTSSTGEVWNCWGRSSGGQVICSGEADSRQADCLAQKNSHAGLLYGLTGVCHQTANRILYPAHCIVSGATNYWLTAFIYGTYGLSVVKFQARIKNCLGEQESQLPRLDSTNGQLSNEAAYLQRINKLHTNALIKYRQTGSTKEQMVFHLLQNELKLTITYRLGSTDSPKVANSLVKHQAELLREKNFYDRALMAKRLDPLHYADKVNTIINTAFKNINKSLGETSYQKMFGIQPEIQLIDPQIMFTCYNKA